MIQSYSVCGTIIMSMGLGKYFYVSTFKYYGQEDIGFSQKKNKKTSDANLNTKVETLFHVKEKNVDR